MSEICRRPSGQPGLRYCPGCHRKIIGPPDTPAQDLCPICGGKKRHTPGRPLPAAALRDFNATEELFDPPEVVRIIDYYSTRLNTREDQKSFQLRRQDLEQLLSAAEFGQRHEQLSILQLALLVRAAGGRIEIEPSVFEDVASYRVVRWTEASTGNVVYEARSRKP